MSVYIKIHKYAILLLLIPIVFMGSCNEVVPPIDNGNGGGSNNSIYKLDSLIRSGSYQTDGSYKWNINFKVVNTVTSTDTINLYLVKSADCPFIIDTTITKVILKPFSFDYKSLSVSIPSQILPLSDYKKSYTISLVLKKGSVIKDSKTFTVNYPLPDHPRLLVRKNEIADLILRYNHADFTSIRNILGAQRIYNSTGIVTTDVPNESIRQKMEALALDYLLDPVNKINSGQQAVQVAINYLTSFGTVGTFVVTDYDDLNYTNEMIIGAAIVYDWCYPIMSFSDKRKLSDAMKLVCKRTEYGLPKTSMTQYLSGHYGELNPTTYLAVGIATFDEDPTFFNFAYNEQVNGFAPSRNPMYASGTHHQGAQYIHCRHSNELIQHFMLNKLSLSPYSNNINTVTFRAVYGMIPQTTDMDDMPEGDGHNGLLMGYPQLFYLSANLSGNSYLQQIAKSNLSLGTFQAARLIMYYNPTISSAPLENNLCLTKYFPSPAGLMIARTKWDVDVTGYGSGAMVVFMNMKEYNAMNHTHLDGGHFGIYYKGHLAIDAGIYQGSDANNGWGATNYNNYYSRTIAHNCMLVYDPNEPLPYVASNARATARDGGQFFFNTKAWDNSTLMLNAGKSAQILSYDIAPGAAPEYSYMKGDLTKEYNVPAYIASYAAKADTVRRSFVFLNHNETNIPGTLIVLDKVSSTNATFKKTWLLHTQNQPVVSGNTIIATSSSGGRNGKLSATVMIPESGNQSIQLVGGPGKEYLVGTTNYGTVTQQDAGQWRVELSPVTQKKSDNFLNVLQAMDISNSAGMTDMEKSYSTDSRYVAIRVKDRIVAENLYLDINSRKIDFTLGNSASSYKVLITDLYPGTWTINSPSGTIQRTVNSTSGTIYFTSSGGRFIATLN